jgi:O-acetyl-ADP-ribose deacetylase (regulator of RNase III)
MTISVTQEDITKIKVDGIVNAAKSSLMGGGGVDGAIHRAGGPAILEECKHIRNKQGRCDTGQAVITTAGDLPARMVIHTVGPIWNGGQRDEAALLKQCYTHSLELAEEHGLTRVAFPNISTGVFGFPKEMACRIALEAVRRFPAQQVEEVIFACFDPENYRLYQEALD